MDLFVENLSIKSKMTHLSTNSIKIIYQMNRISTDHVSCQRPRFKLFNVQEDQGSETLNYLKSCIKKRHHLLAKEKLRLPKNTFQYLYAVQSGALKTYQIGADGKELIRGFYFAGEIFGYEAIYNKHYLFSAMALSETIVCEISYEQILQLLRIKPELQEYILLLISQQLNVGFYVLLASAEQRLAAFLIDLAKRLPVLTQHDELFLPMSRQDIGNYLRLSAETVSRVFSRLQRNHIISIHQKNICFLQREKLQEIAEP
jgi:CRP/FNR family transcriptional regulator, anaerobic regulatory protein